MTPPAPDSAATLRILLADDHEMVRRGTRSLLENQPGWRVCGEAGTGRQAVAAAIELKPDVAVVDVMLPELGGVEVVRQIKKAVPQVEIVTFTGQTSEALVQSVFDAGARSCILKTDGGEHLVRAVRSASEHKPYFTAHASEVIFSRYLHGKAGENPAHPGSPLTNREHEILTLVVQGKSNKEVSKLLDLSVRTVESHRAALMEKLGLHTLPDLVRYAIRNGIIEA